MPLLRPPVQPAATGLAALATTPGDSGSTRGGSGWASPPSPPRPPQAASSRAANEGGATSNYGRIASAAGSPAAVRAADAAIGRNPVSILVPCDRVLGQDGSLTGYAGGLQRKQALLVAEGVLLV